jgi:beta-lactamase superfamily II metal-dependent hydrolase
MSKTKAKSAVRNVKGNQPTSAADSRMTAPPKGVKVRMYRQGLGDCFLLAFPTESKEPFYMMIDCGVILGTPDAQKVMTDVVNDVFKATGGNIHLLAVTHEHWDHVSGIVQAESVFGKIAIQNVWLAWTEDPNNPLAAKLKAEHAKALQALVAAAQKMRLAGSPSAYGVEGLLSFFGEGFSATSGGTTRNAMAAIAKFSKSGPRFCRPADKPIVLSDVAGARFYVLGPPENEERIRRIDPNKSHPETYGLSLNAASAFFAAAAGAAEFGDPAIKELSFPFDRRHRIAPGEAKKDAFLNDLYFDAENNWRKIDSDWLETAGQLALQLDSDTNNTSLVLAIELKDNGKVLLFGADAQVGNWLSWYDQSWNGVTAEDLLKRTVLYKVGHHGSHNATLREQGLEKMTSRDLVAMIPVDHAMAVKKRWNMPFPPLLDRLNNKASGRVLRVDDMEGPGSRPAPSGISKAIWTDFQNHVTATDLYLELTIEG